MNDAANSDQADGDLDRIIEAIANGEPVDWDAEITRRPDLGPVLEPLHVAESLAAYHRGLPRSDEQPQTDPAAPEIDHWGPLRILERIGQGGASEVFRAFDPALRTEVALKLLRPGAGSSARLMDEARRMARVRHPNVLIVHGADVHEGRAGIWTDRIRGLTLEELLAAHGPFGAEESIRIGADLCRALAAVHRAGLIHRDVKTTNVMREQGGRVVLMDFGAGSEREGKTSSLIEDGTPLFMAPEQVRGAPASAASDTYSLGVLLFRLVTGRFPVEARSYAELRELHERGEHLPLRSLRPDLPARFVAVLERALDSAPERRFGDAATFERALLSAAEAIDPPYVFPPAPARKRIWPWAALLVVFVAALGLWSWRSSHKEGALLVSPSPSPASPGDLPLTEGPSMASQGATRPVPAVTSSPPRVSGVTLKRERGGGEKDLGPGDPIAPGDGLSLEIRTDEPLHVYVLDEDEEGQVFVLFPLQGTDLSNPLAPGLHRLPGRHDGRNMSWQVTSAGGKETLIAIAARSNIPALEREIARVPSASLGHPAKMSEGGVTTLRGIGGMAESQIQNGERDRLAGILRGLRSAARNTPWTWQIQLENPR